MKHPTNTGDTMATPVLSAPALLPLLLSFLPAALFAEVGDIHTVKTGAAAIHEAASALSPKLREIRQGAEVMEMSRQGEWYEVFVISSDGAGGWIHRSALALADDAAGHPAAVDTAPPPAAVQQTSPDVAQSVAIAKTKAGAKSEPFILFGKHLNEYNTHAYERENYTPFNYAEELENGHLRLLVTHEWLRQSDATRKNSLMAMREFWRQTSGNNNAIIVAVDSDGNMVSFYP